MLTRQGHRFTSVPPPTRLALQVSSHLSSTSSPPLDRFLVYGRLEEAASLFPRQPPPPLIPQFGLFSDETTKCSSKYSRNFGVLSQKDTIFLDFIKRNKVLLHAIQIRLISNTLNLNYRNAWLQFR